MNDVTETNKSDEGYGGPLWKDPPTVALVLYIAVSFVGLRIWQMTGFGFNAAFVLFAAPPLVVLTALAAVAAALQPPTPWAETSVLAQAISFFAKTTWAMFVIVGSAVISVGISTALSGESADSLAWTTAPTESGLKIIGPYAGVFAFLAGAMVVAQMHRVGAPARDLAVTRLTSPFRRIGFDSRVIERVLTSLTNLGPSAAMFLMAYLTAYVCVDLLRTGGIYY